MCYHLIDKSFHGMWPGQQTKRNTTLNDTGRVKYLQGYIGALLNAVRYIYFNNNLDTESLEKLALFLMKCKFIEGSQFNIW